MILLDTGGILAALDRSERLHEAARSSLEDTIEDLVLSPFVLAEVDYLLTRNLGSGFARRFIDDVAKGAFDLAGFDVADVRHSREILDRYADLDIGLTDASIVVLAERYATNRVLTLDERHFRAMRTLDGRSFTILPADV